jgi:hypothetical protein
MKLNGHEMPTLNESAVGRHYVTVPGVRDASHHL